MKRFTCINDKETKVEGAIEGTKAEVLEWMKKTFPGMYESGESEMMSAIEFFHEGEIKAYKTVDGSNVYLAEVVKEKGQETSRGGNSRANGDILWVWALDYEDINELGRGFSVWCSQTSAKARMEKEIRDLSDTFHGKIEREDDLHAVLDERFYWSIRKIKVHGDQDVDM